MMEDNVNLRDNFAQSGPNEEQVWHRKCQRIIMRDTQMTSIGQYERTNNLQPVEQVFLQEYRANRRRRRRSRSRTLVTTTRATKILTTNMLPSRVIPPVAILIATLVLSGIFQAIVTLGLSTNLTLVHSNTNDLQTSSSASSSSSSSSNNHPPPLLSNMVRLGKQNVNKKPSYHTRATNQSSTSDSLLVSKLDDSQESSKKNLFEKVCIGTANRMSGQSNKTDHYQNLVERYKNCTYVIGNLEITWLERGPSNRPIDLTFLESIREITGYLLIAYVEVDRISMPNLQIIRGRDLFKLNNADHEYAMFVMDNELKSLELPNLREILSGDVGFTNNRNLCYTNTIIWDEIMNPNYKYYYFYDTIQFGPQPDCPKCDKSCQLDSCWGPGSEMCQKFSLKNCSPQCDKGRCFGSGPRECCHLFCAGGCTGPKQTDCLACKNFYNDGECIQECPPMRKYNPSKFLWEADANGKYAFGATCVKECPEHLLRDNGACVRSCPPDKRSLNGECVPCVGPCPKNCQGVDIVNSRNIDQLINCTEIEGSITILDQSFNGYADVNHNNNTMGPKYEPMHPVKLKVLETVKKITGYLSIQAAHPEFKSLSFLNKLEIIGGRQTTDMFHSLVIIKTSLVSLNLRSLKKVRSGKILIEENKNLCFANTTQFVRLGIAKADDITIRNNGNQSLCLENNLKCNSQCGNEGCWGPGPDECSSCKNHKLEDYCVSNCNSTISLGILSFDSGNKTCSRCHPECEGGCVERTARNCFRCKNLKDGPYCVPECPNHKYNDRGVCQECNRNCLDGCTGPSDRLGDGGCNSCGKFVIEKTSPVLVAHCIKAQDQCPAGYYEEYGAPVNDGHPLKQFERKPLCRRCHPRCKSCRGYGTHKDVCECAGYVANDQCEDSCPRDYYADEQSRRCIKCSQECNGCFGPTEAECLNCRVYRIYHEPSGPIASARVTDPKLDLKAAKHQGRFNCTAQCPPDKPHRIVESNLLDPYCSEEPGVDSDSVHVMFIGSTSIFSVIILSAIALCIFVYKCQIDNRSVKQLAMRLSGFEDDSEPLNKSDMPPNLRLLRSITENELQQGRPLGEGFGGTVYQGLWTPDSKKDPIPVAIKVLKDNGRNKEFLDEAYNMASVNHSNLVKLYGVCQTKNSFMLITQLIPLGCLLDYVQQHKTSIRSKYLLEWSRQIASGMSYLEERRMVHRDLALRNVLLQKLDKAIISDFGLAKLLDADQSEYHSGGGRLPIKWLAPECIRERKFTHKSDVWAFGVTIWELLTFGERPFDNYDTKDVPNEIEKGARLPQPNYVSAEIYKLMMSCWFYKPEDRPNFKQLESDLAKFKAQSRRYLQLPNEALETDHLSSQRDSYNHDSDCNDNQPLPTLLNINDNNTNQYNRSEDMFGSFELRHRHSESETPICYLSTPTTKKMFTSETTSGTTECLFGQQLVEDVFDSQQISSKSSNMTITDSNNNNLAFNTSHNRLQSVSSWSVHQGMSNHSLAQKSEQPTDTDDYLLPSPCSNDTTETKFNKFLAACEASTTTAARPQPPPSRDPPHSAGLIGISNQEYFNPRMNGHGYVNSSGPHGVANASSGHIPHSLV